MEIMIILAEVYLLSFSIYHVFQGFLSVFFSEFAIEFNKKLYGYKPKETEQLKMNLKPWGSLAFVVGIIGLIIFFNLKSGFIILPAFALLLIFRMGYRIMYKKTIKEYWQVSNFQNVRTILIQIIGIILFVLLFIKNNNI